MANSGYCSGTPADSLVPPTATGSVPRRRHYEGVSFTAYESVPLKRAKKKLKLIGKFELSNGQNGFFVQKGGNFRLYIDANKNNKFNRGKDALIGHFKRFTNDTSHKHALPGNPAPSELRQGLSRIILEESFISVGRDKKFKIGRNFFKDTRRENIIVNVDMEKNINDAYFYKWGDRFVARWGFASLNDGKPYSTGIYLVSGGGYDCVGGSIIE